MWGDIRYTSRTLVRAPGFTVVVLLTLALGIGANTAIFSLVREVILKPLPFREPARLVAIWDTYFPFFPKLGVSPVELAALEDQTDLFEQTAWYRYVPRDFNLLQSNAPAVEVHATFVSPGLLPLVGVEPALGRGFSRGESPQSVLISDQLWKRRFGGNPRIVGQSIRIGDGVFSIAGVMPPEFNFPQSTDVWLPPGPLLGDELTNPLRHALGFIARLRHGITPSQTDARIETLFCRLAKEHPKTSKTFGVQVVGLQQDLTADRRPALLLLWAAVVLVLLIACGNVANLLLSKTAIRRREFAVRTALGAGTGRIVRQLLTESVVLSALGGALGLIVAKWGLDTFSPVRAPIDWAVLAFLLGISVVSGVLFGLAPALELRKADRFTALKSRSSRIGSLVVILEFAFTVVLLAGAGILAKSFLRLMQVDPGFKSAGVLTLRLSPPAAEKLDGLFDRIEQRLRPLPGVEAIAVVNTLPLIANRSAASRFIVPGSELINSDALPVGQLRWISPEYFRALRIPMKAGRSFLRQDVNQPVVIINESLAQRFWPGQDAVGRKFVIGTWGPNPNWVTIVGVAGDVKQFGLDSEASLDLYLPSLDPTYVVLHATGDPLVLVGAVEREIHAINPDLAISDLRAMDQIVEQSAAARRWTISLLSAFALAALVLALIGIYGVISSAVAQQTREIGIRMALGADRRQVVSMVLRRGFELCLIGLIVGLAAAFALRRILSSLLTFEVSTADPVVLLCAALLMMATALLACYLPARRACRVDPIVVLRWE